MENDIMQAIVNEIMRKNTEENPFFKGNAAILCECLVQYIAFEYDKPVNELSVETIMNELKSIDNLLTKEELSIKVFLLVARAYTERVDNMGLNEEPLDCLFLLRQSDNVLQSTYNAFTSVLEGTTLNNEFVSVSTFGFMNKRVKKLSNQYKWKIKEELREQQ